MARAPSAAGAAEAAARHAFDPFGYTAERRMERALIKQYEADHGRGAALLTPRHRAMPIALARLPLDIRGFGPVKARTLAKPPPRAARPAGHRSAAVGAKRCAQAAE
jgi:indolepyruvate ferredoxin oxidoreductase